MARRFPGFPPEMIRFFSELERNNRREWFQEHKAFYEEKVKGPMTALVEAVNLELLRFSPEHVTDPKKAIYRIYRDTRFSKDKTPYKLQIGATFPRRPLARHIGGGYYFHVSAKEVLVAGGAYRPGREELLAIRSHIAANHERLEKILRSRRLRSLMGELYGEELSRAPKGFSPDHPAVDLLRKQQWLFSVSLPPERALGPELQREILKRFRALKEFVDFLNEPLVARLRESRPDPLAIGPAPSFRPR